MGKTKGINEIEMPSRIPVKNSSKSKNNFIPCGNLLQYYYRMRISDKIDPLFYENCKSNQVIFN